MASSRTTGVRYERLLFDSMDAKESWEEPEFDADGNLVGRVTQRGEGIGFDLF